MQNKKIAYFLSIILFFSVFLFNVDAISSISNPNVSFHCVGITINLTFPQEAHPLDNISHNITITADAELYKPLRVYLTSRGKRNTSLFYLRSHRSKF
jgi:hypothetical protein